MEEEYKQGETNCHSNGTIKSEKNDTKHVNDNLTDEALKLQSFNPVFENGDSNVKNEEENKSSKKLASSVRLENLMGHGRFQQFQIWVFAALVSNLFSIYLIQLEWVPISKDI
jgi:hypothetical protein